MAILQQSQTEIEGGFKKQIDEGAMSLMMEILQRYQYQFPIRSSIREITSNGIDSIKEREVAREILTGKAKVEDYFVDLEGDMYKDSKFDPSYYDLKWFSTDPNVYITYHSNSDLEKDFVTIKDNGVGLGQYRLEKYFNLGYSTKRLSKLPLGKFGLGNKAPLSINSHYTVESRYNGFLFRFMVYNGKVESIIPKMNLTTGTENTEFKMGGISLYAETTTEFNGVTIIIDAKKHHRSEYEDAVKSQLTYFDNIVFTVVSPSSSTQIPVKSNILFEDDFILLSDNRYYDKPHILINRVNYGFINFSELELENKNGNIGIKVQPEDVEVTPSRESLVWSEKTKTMILNRFRDTQASATVLVQKELSSETDIVNWIRKCASLNSSLDRNSVLGRLSQIIDISQVSPLFRETEIRLTPYLLDFLRVRKVHFEITRQRNKVKTKISRVEAKSMWDFSQTTIVLKSSSTSNRKDKYLLSIYDKLLVIDRPFWFGLENGIKDTSKNDFEFLVGTKIHQLDNDVFNSRVHVTELIWAELLKSSIPLIYEDIEVPENFKGTDTDDEEEQETESLSDEELKAANLSKEERRKLEGKLIVNTPRSKVTVGGINSSYYSNSVNDNNNAYDARLYEWQKLEVPIAEINNWDVGEIYYGNDADIKTLEFTALLTRDTRQESVVFPRANAETYNSGFMYNDSDLLRSYGLNCSEAFRCAHYFKNDDIRIIKVSQSSSKYFKDFKHINKFFAQINNGTITMSNILIQWNTARQLATKINQVAFLYNFSLVPEKQEEYRKIVEYTNKHFTDLKNLGKISDENSQAYETMINHLDKVQQFQTFVKSSNNPEDIATLAVEMWRSDTVTDGYAVDLTLLESLDNLIEWSASIKNMFNFIPVLTGYAKVEDAFIDYNPYKSRVECPIPTDLHFSIISYLETKNLT